MVHVLPPVVHLLHGAAADVAHDVRLGAKRGGERQVLVRADAVVLRDAAPVRVHDAGALLARPDAVTPVVRVRETTAGPADVGDLDAPERLHDVVAHVPRLAGRPARPHAVVDEPAEVLGELAEDVTADCVASGVGVDGELRGARRLRGQHRRSRCQEEHSLDHAQNVLGDRACRERGLEGKRNGLCL